MQIRDLNNSADLPAATGRDAPTSMVSAAIVGSQSCRGTDDAEIAFLKARIEHLELVVETARALMTSNQERLLRRLYELPKEMAALASSVDRSKHAPA